jgi:hydroxyacylglutathione hydrolase
VNGADGKKRGTGGREELADAVITLQDLQRIAKELNEDVDEATLKDMMVEANGGRGRGVNIRDFEGVMRRAGVFR